MRLRSEDWCRTGSEITLSILNCNRTGMGVASVS
jgi:hypothetical protein